MPGVCPGGAGFRCAVEPSRRQALGGAVLLAGLACIGLGVPTHSSLAFLVGTVLGGLGVGVAIQGAGIACATLIFAVPVMGIVLLALLLPLLPLRGARAESGAAGTAGG